MKCGIAFLNDGPQMPSVSSVMPDWCLKIQTDVTVYYCRSTMALLLLGNIPLGNEPLGNELHIC
jgi:hypothetical protein